MSLLHQPHIHLRHFLRYTIWFLVIGVVSLSFESGPSRFIFARLTRLYAIRSLAPSALARFSTLTLIRVITDCIGNARIRRLIFAWPSVVHSCRVNFELHHIRICTVKYSMIYIFLNTTNAFLSRPLLDFLQSLDVKLRFTMRWHRSGWLSLLRRITTNYTGGNTVHHTNNNALTRKHFFILTILYRINKSGKRRNINFVNNYAIKILVKTLPPRHPPLSLMRRAIDFSIPRKRNKLLSIIKIN